jgi:hypothetical protein
VNTILEVHKKYNALVLTAFNNDSGFVAALDKACGRFINSNAVTRQANSSSKSPELLAKYCDLLLKKSSKNPEEAELEDTLNQVVSINIEPGTFLLVLHYRCCTSAIKTSFSGRETNVRYVALTAVFLENRGLGCYAMSCKVIHNHQSEANVKCT